MKYFLFNNDIFVSTGRDIQRLSREDRGAFDGRSVASAHVCLVDVDVLVAVAPEERPEQKDLVLSREFARMNSGEYIIQDERVGTNQFQVMGAKRDKVREVYSLIPAERVATFAPYAMAVRAYLNTQNIPAQKILAFVDDLAGEALITFYDGLKFSATRRFSGNDIERILPEIRRSAIGFCKSIKRDNDPYLVVTNNADWEQKIKGMDPLLETYFVSAMYPAIEGLKNAQFPVKFELPEDVLKRTRQKERQARIPYFMAASALAALGLCCMIFYRISFAIQETALRHAEHLHSSLESRLAVLDPEIYRSALKQQKKIHYGEVYYWLKAVIPPSYEIVSFSITDHGKARTVHALLSLVKGQAYEEIPVVAGLGKRMVVENILVKDRPGKSVRIEL